MLSAVGSNIKTPLKPQHRYTSGSSGSGVVASTAAKTIKNINGLSFRLNSYNNDSKELSSLPTFISDKNANRKMMHMKGVHTVDENEITAALNSKNTTQTSGGVGDTSANSQVAQVLSSAGPAHESGSRHNQGRSLRINSRSKKPPLQKSYNANANNLSQTKKDPNSSTK